MLRLFSAAVLLSVTSFSAQAQTFSPLTDQRSAYDWSGFYLGTQVGWGWANQHLTDGSGLDGDLGLNGDFFGSIGGFQKQWNNWVIGAEVEANWSDVDGQDTIPGALGRTFGGVEIFGSAGAKVGYAWNRVLLYGTGGLSGAETETLFRDGEDSSEDHGASFGWMAGAGIDYAITDNVILGVQYRHYDFGTADFDELGFEPKRKGETDMDAVTGHLVFKLNRL